MALAEFAHRVTKDGRVFISFRGRRVTVLAGEAARRFIARAATANEHELQHLLARATGHFRRTG